MPMASPDRISGRGLLFQGLRVGPVWRKEGLQPRAGTNEASSRRQTLIVRCQRTHAAAKKLSSMLNEQITQWKNPG